MPYTKVCGFQHFNMAKGQYDTIKYVGQELHYALSRMFHRKQAGPITIYHRDDEASQESRLSYSVSGLEIQLLVSKIENGYHLVAMVGVEDSHHLETKADRDLQLKRSKEGRLSPNSMDSIAHESLKYLREYHRAREVKQ